MNRVQHCLVLITLIQLLMLMSTTSQRFCQFVNSQNITTSTNGNSVYINNFSANKCLRIGDFGHFPSKLFLDECFWGVTTISKDENLYLRNSSLVPDGVTVFNNAGLGEGYCLSISKDGFLETANCRTTSWDQAWRIKAVRGYDNQFQIQQVSSTLCIIPKSRAAKSPILLTACNSYQTEQLWKICATNDLPKRSSQ